MKPASGSAGARIVAAELFDQLLVAMHDPIAPFHLRLGVKTPSDACSWVRTEPRPSSVSSSPPFALSSNWSGCEDLNLGPPRSERGALIWLSYTPSSPPPRPARPEGDEPGAAPRAAVRRPRAFLCSRASHGCVFSQRKTPPNFRSRGLGRGPVGPSAWTRVRHIASSKPAAAGKFGRGARIMRASTIAACAGVILGSACFCAVRILWLSHIEHSPATPAGGRPITHVAGSRQVALRLAARTMSPTRRAG